MQIQCPSCHSRAQLPSDKEGAKVRCGECGRVFVARSRLAASRGRGGSSGGPNLGLLGGLGAGALLLMVLWFVTRGGDEATPALAGVGSVPAAAPDPAPDTPDPTAWDGPLFRSVLALHEAYRNANSEALERRLDARLFWHAEEIARAAETGAEPRDPGAYAILAPAEVSECTRRFIASLKDSPEAELLSEWEPYDGEVLDFDHQDAVVRLTLGPITGGTEKRWLDWTLHKDRRGEWRATAWKRFGEDPEQEVAGSSDSAPSRAKASEAQAPVKEITFADGKTVFERDPEPLEHLESTPPDMRRQIDQLLVTMTNLDLTRESAAAMREMVAMGKPAIPLLLTGIYQAKLDSDESRIKANIMVIALRNITGEAFGYDPQARLGGETGFNEERTDSAIKQWFAWWYLNRQSFEEKNREDLLKDHIQLTEKDKAWLRRHADK